MFYVSPLVSFVFLNKRNAWKTWKCFWFRSKTVLMKKKHFLFDIFVSPSYFPLLQDIWFKHVAKRIEFIKTNKKCTQNVTVKVGKMANIKKENSKICSEDQYINLLLWNVTSADYKDQNRKSLPLEEGKFSFRPSLVNT